jgi:predicted nucleic acid-binding protein
MSVAGLFAPKWTRRIEDEWIRNLEANRPELVGKLERRRDNMRQAVPDWEVSTLAVDSLSAGITLPDPDDVHVLAAAIAGHADCIVTFNIKDFPSELLDPYGICVIHPDDFLIAQYDLDPLKALEAFKEMRSRSKRPPLTPEEFADAFERNGLVATAQRLREAAALI